MKSNVMVFYKNGYLKRGMVPEENVLPFEKFKLLSDLTPEWDTELCESYVKKAEKYLNEELTILPLSLYREYSKTRVRSNFEKYHHKRRDIIFYLTIAEAYERKGRFLEKLVDFVWAVLEETEWVIPAHYYHSLSNPLKTMPDNYKEEDVPGLDLYSANCCATLALVRYFLSDELDKISPVICKRIDHQIYLRGIRPFIVATFGWSSGHINNWLTNITQSILFACAITVRDFDTRRRVMSRAMSFLDYYTSYYPLDGCCDEGPAYWGAAPANLFDCLEILEDMSGGTINVYHEPIIRNMGEYIANFNIDGKYYINFADAHPVIDHDGKEIMRYGKKCGSEAMYSFGKMIASIEDIDRYRFFGHCGKNIRNLFIKREKDVPKVKANVAVWYDSLKVAIFRENPDTSKGLFLATKGGNNGEAHNHNDVGCLVIYKNGKPVIVDPALGSYNHDYFGAARYGRWYTQAGYHSVPTVDGKDEVGGAKYSSSDEVCDLEEKVVKMELKGAFPEDAGILKMERTCKLDGGVATVTDDIALDHEGDIQFNFLTVDEPIANADGSLTLKEGVIFRYDPALKLVIEKVENKWLPYEDLSFKSNWGTECLWRITLRARTKEQKCTVTFE